MTDIASHRGGALLWPENSRIAFENTTKLAVEQVEFDVHPTRDGKLVVIHDDTLDRTTDGRGPVAVQDWSTLSKLVLKGTGGQRMLLLDEVIEIFRPTPIRKTSGTRRCGGMCRTSPDTARSVLRRSIRAPRRRGRRIPRPRPPR